MAKTQHHSRRPHWGAYSAKQGEACDILAMGVMGHVPFDGFSVEALTTAASECDIDIDYARSLFPNPESDIIAWHSMLGDSNMLDEYQKTYAKKKLRVPERIEALVMIRFEQNASHREAIRIALRKLSLPRYSGLGLRLLYRSCDNIWDCAGDTATDWNFYSKRSLLAGVYLATLPIWLDDESEDLSITREFLRRRLDNVAGIPKMRGKLCGKSADLNQIMTRPFRFFRALSRYSQL